MTIELTLELDIRFVKYGNKHRAISDKYKLIGRSEVNDEEAQKNLIEQLEVMIWSESFSINYRIKTK